MPAPVILCSNCQFKIVYNPEFTPTRCPRCLTDLKNSPDSSMPHGSVVAPHPGGIGHLMPVSDPRGIYRKIKNQPITDAEIERRKADGTLDDIK